MPSESPFFLHPRLEADTFSLGRTGLCRLLLMNENRYPWLILVPERPQLVEISDLNETDQYRLIDESSRLSRHLQWLYPGCKMNIAAIGNVVSQLHVHHVVRFQGDPAWPHPVWGRDTPQFYSEEERAEIVGRLMMDALPGWTPMEVA